MESQDTTPEAAPEVEETMNGKDWRILKDNQLWEKQDDNKERSQDIDNGEKVQADVIMRKAWGTQTPWYKPETCMNFDLIQ